MSDLKSALLPNRGVIAVSGPDAKKLLQGVVTADMELPGPTPVALHSGLLSPQGKILFDFFIVPHGGGYLIETGKAHIPDLVKRLSMYKLRASAEIRDVSADYTVAAVWGANSAAIAGRVGCIAFIDPRLPDMGGRLLMTLANDAVLKDIDADAAGQPAYDAHRISLGVPEAGKDFVLGDTFPHEALYDQLAGVSFTKGCFVGQEVVSRMQHRGTARKRVVRVVADSPLPETGTQVRAGSSLIGTLGTVEGTEALAMLRIDRAAEAIAKGETLHAGDAAIEIKIPSWATFSMTSTGEDHA